jgi:tRNA(Ile)-lysidine synthase
VGHSEAEKVKVLFHQARVPLWERRHWPVVTMGEAILWVRRFGPAAGFAANRGGGQVLGIREAGL